MSEGRFITVTLNPLFEWTLVAKYLAVGYQNTASERVRLDPSGDGMNIARALDNLGCATHAVVPLGKDLTGRIYRTLVGDDMSKISTPR